MSGEPIFMRHLRGRLMDGETVTHHPNGGLAPFAMFDAPRGFGEETWTDSQPESVISIKLKGGDVFSHVPGAMGRCVTAMGHEIALQPLGGCNHYSCGGGVRFVHFYITDVLLSRVAEGFNLPGFGHGALRPDLIALPDPDLWHLVRYYGERALDQRVPASRIELEARALLVVERLVGRHHIVRSPANRRGGLAPWQLKRVLEAMEDQLGEDLALADLARIAGCSPTHFSRAFKQSVGVAPFRWLHQRRIEKAKHMLANSGWSLAEIALEVGFSAQPHFTTAFGQATGLTPGAWRRQRLG